MVKIVNPFIVSGKIPTKEQFEELLNACRWLWMDGGYKVTGPNGNSIVLPAAGYCYCSGGVSGKGDYGNYWSSTPLASEYAWGFGFGSSGLRLNDIYRCYGMSVRLVRD